MLYKLNRKQLIIINLFSVNFGIDINMFLQFSKQLNYKLIIWKNYKHESCEDCELLFNRDKILKKNSIMKKFLKNQFKDK